MAILQGHDFESAVYGSLLTDFGAQELNILRTF